MPHFVYIVRCADGSFYTGYTTDLARRVAEHNGEDASQGRKSAAARYTRGRRPVELVYSESFATRSEALQREAEIKKLTRAHKLQLIQS